MFEKLFECSASKVYKFFAENPDDTYSVKDIGTETSLTRTPVERAIDLLMEYNIVYKEKDSNRYGLEKNNFVKGLRFVEGVGEKMHKNKD